MKASTLGVYKGHFWATREILPAIAFGIWWPEKFELYRTILRSVMKATIPFGKKLTGPRPASRTRFYFLLSTTVFYQRASGRNINLMRETNEIFSKSPGLVVDRVEDLPSVVKDSLPPPRGTGPSDGCLGRKK